MRGLAATVCWIVRPHPVPSQLMSLPRTWERAASWLRTATSAAEVPSLAR
jgi:hypothetical protein